MQSNNIPQAGRTAAYYDELWEENTQPIEALIRPGSFGEARILFIQEALQFIHDQAGQPLQILDLGCGSGWIETFLHPYGEVTAVDFSPRAINRAQEKYGSYAKFILGDPTLFKLGLAEDKLFDVVVTSEVIEHVEDQKTFVHQIANFLKPQGWCVLTTPNGAVWERYRKDQRYQPALQPIENWLTAGECAALFRRTGFEVIKHEGWSSPLYPHAPLVRPFTSRKGKKVFISLGLIDFWKRLMLYHGLLQFLVVRRQELT